MSEGSSSRLAAFQTGTETAALPDVTPASIQTGTTPPALRVSSLLAAGLGAHLPL